jgi:O-6-methylguanine DNA methyltransferase
MARIFGYPLVGMFGVGIGRPINLTIYQPSNLPIPMPRRSDFASRVRSVVRRIPYGRVATYGDVAAVAGRPRAHRAVGNIMRATSDSSIPCHRVIAAGGKLGGYGRDLFAKRALLLAEGILVSSGRIRDFAEKRWKILH